MTAECKRKQVTYEQLIALLEFLKEHEDLAKGLTRGRRRRGKFHTVKVWNLCAKKLNAIKDGAIKDGKGWSKYWCDWKYRVRRRALELKAAEGGNRPLPEGILPLSPMEENIMSIIGESAIEGVVILNDPLSEGGIDEVLQNYDQNDDSSVNQYFESEATENPAKRRKILHTSNDDTAGPGGAPETKLIVDNTENGDRKLKSSVGRRSAKRRRKQLSKHFEDDQSRSSSSSERKPEVVMAENENDVDSDSEDKALAFLSIEREKLFGTSKIIKTLGSIHSEISRLTTVMADIKDCIKAHYRSTER